MKRTKSLLRLAVIATPRSGHTWLRLMLQESLELTGLPIHHPDECPWHDLPPRLLLAVHWPRTLELESRLAQHGFRIIGIQRHPLDTLLSILHVSLHDVQSHRWLNGEAGNEDGIVGAMPRSQAFLDYAVGPRAAALFNVNLQWHDHPGRYNLRYEDMVARTEEVLEKLFAWLGETPRLPAGAVVARHALAAVRKSHYGHGHFWKGQPGLWRSLLCSSEAELIARAHAESFRRFGYSCDPAPALTPAQADRNWIDLIREEQRLVRAETIQTRLELEAEQRQVRWLLRCRRRRKFSQRVHRAWVELRYYARRLSRAFGAASD